MVANVAAANKTPRQVSKGFRDLLASGYELRVDGRAKSDPAALLRRGYSPKYEIELFGTRFFLCNLRISHDLKLMPAYVLPAAKPGRRKRIIHARVFYKDSSLVWRVVSHYINTPDEQWIGKGAIKWHDKRGESGWSSAEETTNLPFEMQAALDEVSHRGPRGRYDENILFLIARNAPTDRLQAYHDFVAPRARAMKVAANRINNNRPVAWFTDENDPASLKIAPGFEPDFKMVIDVSTSHSKMYGGEIRKFRIASRNRRIQYLFIAGPHHVWLIHPQSLTVELSSYGLRTVDIIADDEMCIPGYEFFDNEGSGEVDDQIPSGFAGPVCPYDPDRADASPWNDRMPIVRAFRRAKL
jgi:hypothetical protein